MSINLAAGVVYTIASKNQFTLLQDGYHNLADNFQFVYSRQVVDALAKAGVKHFFAEYETDPYQKFVDDYVAGKTSYAQFKDQMKDSHADQPPEEREKTFAAFADFVKYSASKGIKFHAIDFSTPADHAYTVVDYIENTEGLTLKDVKPVLERGLQTADLRSAKVYEGALEYFSKYPDSTRIDSADFTSKLYQDSYGKRVNADEKYAQIIKSTCGKERGAINLGAGHGSTRNGSNGRDIDEHLGPDTGKLLLTPNLYTHMSQKENETEAAVALVYTGYLRSNDPVPMVLKNQIDRIGGEVKGSPSVEDYIALTPSTAKQETLGELAPSASLGQRISSMFSRGF